MAHSGVGSPAAGEHAGLRCAWRPHANPRRRVPVRRETPRRVSAGQTRVAAGVPRSGGYARCMGCTRAWMLVGLVALAACQDRALDESDAERLLPLEPEESATLAGRVGASWIFDVEVSSSDVTDEIDASVD